VKAFIRSLPLLLVVSLSVSSPALAETAGPGWELTSQSYPTNLSPGGKGQIVINVLNVGAGLSDGPVTVTDTLPPGLEATDAGALHNGNLGRGAANVDHHLWECAGTTVVTCTNNATEMPGLAGGGGGVNTPTFGLRGREADGNLDPQIAIAVNVTGSPAVAANRVTIAGGGAFAPASTSEPVVISPAPPGGFAIAGWDGWFSNADGTLDTQAGSHPYAATFSLNFATVATPTGLAGYGLPGGNEARSIEATLPAGFVGDPSAVPQCSGVLLSEEKCPLASQIGLLEVYVTGGAPFRARVFNIVPPAGVPAEFAAIIAGIVTTFDASVRSGGDYGITEHINNIPRKNLLANVLTLWGVPADHSHDRFRTGADGGCKEANGKIVPEEGEGGLQCVPSTAPLKPFLTLPTACGAPQPFSLRLNTWQDGAYGPFSTFLTHDSSGSPVGFTGCEQLGFAPLITTAPDTASADTPAGLTVEVKPPIGGLSEPGGLSTSDIQNTTVTLPAGLVINPGQAAGLQACQASQARVGDGVDDPPVCPLASKIGVVEIETPLLPHSLKGNVFILQSNPPNLEMLVAASGEGVNLKLVGNVHLDEATGRLTSTFSGTPELPFTNFMLSFSGGAQAALDTPTQCGTYSSSADFSPWSSPFLADFLTGSSFQVTSGPNGGPCPASPMPFAPSLTAGSTTDQAGAFTNFSLLLQRGDGQQRIERLQFREPAGLAGMISNVPLCAEPQASQGACPDSSKIGHAAVASGPGPYPLTIPQPGHPESPIYLTGPYQGAPFGLSILTHVIAGPFNLGDIVTRAKIEIDRTTAQITVTTDPLPQIVAGVPTDLRLIDSVIDRPNFLFNPTNCSPQEFTGTAWGTPPPGAGGPGATAAVSSHFGIGSCRELGFHPNFSVFTSARTSKAQGASLTAKLSYPKAPQGTQAEISKVKVELPLQLPSQLKTLQKACIDKVFEANPAACPPESIIGHAVVHTQLLPVPLTGPAYFVSHGGEAFPSLTMVLQGYGVKIELVGATLIRNGITSTTFKTVPDVPFEDFELTLPQGKYAALAANLPAKANGNLCGQKLVMPIEMIAQNGLETHQNTPITVTGCPKAKTRAQLYAAALKVCHKKHNKTRRQSCERQARRKYGPIKKKK
jgi:hypothetical protein